MKYLLLLSISLQLTSTTTAQPGKGVNVVSLDKYEEYAAKETAYMKDYLNLTSDQSDSVLQINRAYFFKIGSLKDLKLEKESRTRYIEKVQLGWEENLMKLLGEGMSKKYFNLLAHKQKIWYQKQKLMLSNKQ